MAYTKYKTTSANGIFSGVYFMGRWTTKTIQNQPTMYTTNLGAAVLLMTKNTDHLNLQLLNTTATNRFQPEIAVFIDDQPEVRFKVNEVPDELQLQSNAPHVVRLVFAGNSDADEVWLHQQGLAISKITISDGELTAIKPAGKAITFIGDSITAGCWVKSRHPAAGYAAELNYAAQTAQALNAEDIRIAYSAAGLLRYGTGGVPAAPRFINYLDFETKMPLPSTDLIVINLGSNDRQFSSEVMQTQYVKFFKALRHLSPTATLNIMIPFNQSFAAELRVIAHQNPQLNLIETKDWPITYTDQVHPDLSGSQLIAKRLTQALTSHYGQAYFAV
ncbi:SGNH/GDSL hydrolase family protein [Pediococcus siamensis]|uniref:SGNH/GDSL hydrolase family protein n=1 Tax=Pediococcus siamensis TaxID=381829 RepID=UPI00399FBF54